MTTFNDPPAPKPLQPGEKPPAQSGADLLKPGGQATTWEFNPDYQKLVELWQQVLPLLDKLVKSLDGPYKMAQDKDVWDAPVGDRYVAQIAEWQKMLLAYRKAVLTSISEQAADTPRWVPKGAKAPHAFVS